MKGADMQEVFEKIIDQLKAEGIIVDDDAGNRAVEIIEQAAAEYNNGWIPCSERLPEVEADVLLSLRSLDIFTGFRANTDGYFYVEGEGYVKYEKVLAWQPLPEPYQQNVCTADDCPINDGNECPASEGCAGYEPKGE
ncbi:MAG: DUF551 domain-containing protein [Lachnospiraceae bacterium]